MVNTLNTERKKIVGERSGNQKDKKQKEVTRQSEVKKTQNTDKSQKIKTSRIKNRN